MEAPVQSEVDKKRSRRECRQIDFCSFKMNNMMSVTEVDKYLQLEVALPLAMGISMLMYSIYFLFTYKESKGRKKSSARKSSSEKATRRSVRESKKPKVWSPDDEEEEEPKSPFRASRRVKSPAKTPKK